MECNHFAVVGRIPDGTQFRTFEAASFEGNLGLCEFPLPKCREHLSASQLEVDEDDREWIDMESGDVGIWMWNLTWIGDRIYDVVDRKTNMVQCNC